MAIVYAIFAFLKEFLGGFLKIVWEVAKTTIPLPIGLIVVVFIFGFVYNKNAVSVAVKTAIVNLVAQAELQAKDNIIANKQKIIDNKEKLLNEKQEIIEKDKQALEEFSKTKEEYDQLLAKKEAEINELQTNQGGQPAVSSDFFNSLLNR